MGGIPLAGRLTSLNNLPALLCSKGDYAAAEALYRRGLEVRERVVSPSQNPTRRRFARSLRRRSQ